MEKPSYLPMCKACWEYYGKPPICAIAVRGGVCRRCGKPDDLKLPKPGQWFLDDDDPMAGLHAIPVEVILAKDGSLPEEPDPENRGSLGYGFWPDV